MPVLKRFGAFVVTMYFENHNPPHVHVLASDWEAQVTIADGTVLRGAIPGRPLRAVRTWLSRNRPALTSLWDEYQ
jgi:hypothetical protein